MARAWTSWLANPELSAAQLVRTVVGREKNGGEEFSPCKEIRAAHYKELEHQCSLIRRLPLPSLCRCRSREKRPRKSLQRDLLVPLTAKGRDFSDSDKPELAKVQLMPLLVERKMPPLSVPAKEIRSAHFKGLDKKDLSIRRSPPSSLCRC